MGVNKSCFFYALHCICQWWWRNVPREYFSLSNPSQAPLEEQRKIGDFWKAYRISFLMRPTPALSLQAFRRYIGQKHLYLRYMRVFECRKIMAGRALYSETFLRVSVLSKFPKKLVPRVIFHEEFEKHDVRLPKSKHPILVGIIILTSS